MSCSFSFQDIYSVSNYIFWFQFGPIKRKCTKQISRIWIHCNTSFRGATPTVASLKPLNISLIQADVRPKRERKKDVLYILHHELDFQYNEENHFSCTFAIWYMENMPAKNWYYWKALLKLKQLLMVDIGRFILISHFNFGRILQSPKSLHITTKYPSAFLSLLATEGNVWKWFENSGWFQ